MEVELSAAAEEDKVVLGNLIQLYRHDLSDFRGYELSEHGTFVYRFLDHYFLDEGREALLVRADGRLAGFAMSRPIEDDSREVAEFFVVRAHRRSGVGRRAAELLFARHPGRWTVAFDNANTAAAAFWPNVAGSVAAGRVDRQTSGPPDRTYCQSVLRFETR